MEICKETLSMHSTQHVQITLNHNIMHANDYDLSVSKQETGNLSCLLKSEPQSSPELRKQQFWKY